MFALRVCYTQGVSFEVIVVDNASFDGSAEMLAREFPAVLFVQSAEEHRLCSGQ